MLGHADAGCRAAQVGGAWERGMHGLAGSPMSIALDQTRLRQIMETVLQGSSLDRAQATTILQFAQLAAGVDLDDDPAEQAILQTLAQQIASVLGTKPDDVLPIPPLPDEDARLHWLGALASELETRGARELAFVLAFLVSVADLDLNALEMSSLEELQRVLGVDEQRATDLVVFVTETVASGEASA